MWKRTLVVGMMMALVGASGGAAYATSSRHHPHHKKHPTTTTTRKPVTTTTARATTTTTTRVPTTTTSSTTTTTTSGPVKSGWAQNATWQWQLSTPVDTSVPAQVFDIDGFDNTAATVAKLHAQGSKVICYIDVGTWENWRSDAAQFPDSVKGKSNGWPGEKWLDIRSDVIRPILDARFRMCADKGFDAVEPDNVDGYDNSTGFAITAADQITFNTWFAGDVHAHGMTVALKNDVDQIAQLQPYFDFAINEECNRYNECGSYSAFINAGKWVGQVEYKGATSTFCPADNKAKFMGMLKDLNLTATRTTCW